MGFRHFGLWSFAVAAAGAFAACSSKNSTPPPAPASCSPPVGQAPDPTCNDVPANCSGTPPAIMPCSGASACLASGDNGGKSVLDFRVRKLHVAAPASLALPFVQQTLVDQGINLTTACEGGDDGFNLLLRLDTAAKTLTIGSGPPLASSVGYCFLQTTAAGPNLSSVTVAASQAADGTWETNILPQELDIAIYAHGQAGNLVVLPLSHGRIQSMRISTDGNCVGSYTTGCPRWLTAAALTGYITLEAADRVEIPDLACATLCSVLEPGSVADGGLACARDASGHIVAQGDYCSQTNSAATATCADSVWLAATFAASAIAIVDGASVAQCNGSSDGGAAGVEGGCGPVTP